MPTTKCMYCNARSYGPGCPYSGHGKHVHTGDNKKCVYCGSYSVGPGCLFNPFAKVHVHGVEFNQMVRDSVNTSIITGYLINKLSTPINETIAYKLGIVDSDGKKLKEPTTLEEKQAYTSTDSYVFNLKRTLGSKLDLINSLVFFEQVQPIQAIDKEAFAKQYELEYNFKKQIDKLAQEFIETISEGLSKGLSTPAAERIIIEALVNKPS